MARRVQSNTTDFRPKFVDFPSQGSLTGPPVTQKGNRSYTAEYQRTSPEDIFEVLDGATVHSPAGSWRLNVWSIHQIGSEHWLQMSATRASVREDLVVHMVDGTRARDALASVEGWLGYPVTQSRVIHVV